VIVMRRKKKGIRAERELLDKLWNYGIGAIRVAGSGSTGHPSADIIAGYRGKLAVIEVKTTSKESIYVGSDEVQSMRSLAEVLGAECWLAVKFSADRGKFYMVRIPDARETSSGSVVIDLSIARSKGLPVEMFAKYIFQQSSSKV